MATVEATRIYQFIINNHTSFQLWWKENLLNHQKVSKYCDYDCRKKLTKIIIFSLEKRKDVTGEMTDRWKETILQTILNNYSKSKIYIADEFRLFYQVLARKTLHLKDEKCTVVKHRKTRLTGLVAANMNGDKLPMCFIKMKNPSCFKHVKKCPCCYRAQKKSWTDSQLFEELVRELDDQFTKKNWKVALITDSCTRFNPLTNNFSHHIETSQLIWIENPSTGYFIMGNIGH